MRHARTLAFRHPDRKRIVHARRDKLIKIAGRLLQSIFVAHACNRWKTAARYKHTRSRTQRGRKMAHTAPPLAAVVDVLASSAAGEVLARGGGQGQAAIRSIYVKLESGGGRNAERRVIRVSGFVETRYNGTIFYLHHYIFLHWNTDRAGTLCKKFRLAAGPW